MYVSINNIKKCLYKVLDPYSNLTLMLVRQLVCPSGIFLPVVTEPIGELAGLKYFGELAGQPAGRSVGRSVRPSVRPSVSQSVSQSVTNDQLKIQ